MSFRPSQRIIYSAPGTYTWTCPPDLHFIDLTLIGAGGGGGGGGAGAVGGDTILSGTNGGGGGGASGGAGTSGEYNSLKSVAVTPGSTYVIKVGQFGQGGDGGASSGSIGAQGQNGDDTTFVFPNLLTLKSSGGIGGGGGNGGHAGSGSSSGAGGASVTEASPPNMSVAWDGSQSGLAGGNSLSLDIASGSGNTQLQIYQIFTDIGGTPTTSNFGVTPSNTNYGFTGVYGPFGEFPGGSITGNTALDSPGSMSLDQTVFYSRASTATSGPNFAVFFSVNAAGGAGGVLSLTSLIPIYYIGIDFNTVTLPIILPFFQTFNGYGLGDGAGTVTIGFPINGRTPGSASTLTVGSFSFPAASIVVQSTRGFSPSGTIFVTSDAGIQTVTYTGTTTTSFTGCSGGTGSVANSASVTQANNGSIGFWRDGTATIIGYGAGGLGGPGGGGAEGFYLAFGTIGHGYHGDQGLSGMVMISWS